MAYTYHYFTGFENRKNADDAREIMARNVAALRKQQHMSAAELSRLTGIGRPLLARIENAAADIRLSYVQKLADAFGVSVERLFESPPST